MGTTVGYSHLTESSQYYNIFVEQSLPWSRTLGDQKHREGSQLLIITRKSNCIYNGDTDRVSILVCDRIVKVGTKAV